MDHDLPIIDAHQHFWDLGLGRHPWLCGDEQISFRYGDYSALKERNYLPADYLRDTEGFNVVKSIYMEAEWDPADPLGETAWVMDLHERTGFPHAVIGQAWFMADDIEAFDEDHDTDVVAMLRDLARAVDTLRSDVAMTKGKAMALEVNVEVLRDLLAGRR